jgi:hypothetical protein
MSDVTCRLPKRNKKEYAGSARAEKEALSEQRMAACREFIRAYEDAYAQLHNSYRAQYVEVGRLLLLHPL